MVVDRRKLWFVTGLLAVSLLVSGYASGAAHATPTAEQAIEASAHTTAKHKLHVVQMGMKNFRFEFEPKTVVANVGDIVEWKNTDIYEHNAVSVDHRTFHSPILKPKGSWRYKTVKKGTYHYTCTLHPNMTGTLIVR